MFNCQQVFLCLAGERYGLKKTIKSLENRNMELEEQVHELDKVSSEKDFVIEQYKIQYKEG